MRSTEPLDCLRRLPLNRKLTVITITGPVVGPLLDIFYTHPFSSLTFQVRVQRGANRREAGRMREGHMDASDFLIASAMYFYHNI